MAFLSSRNGITILTLFTAAVHLILGLTVPDTLFILNGVGYLLLLWATFWTPGFLKSQSGLVRWAFIAFVVSTIVLFFVFNGSESFKSAAGLVTKFVEVLLLLGLWQSRSK